MLTLQYAIEHRLPVLSPDWIEWNHQRWLNGEDVEYDVSGLTHFSCKRPRADLWVGRFIPFASIRRSDHLYVGYRTK